MFGASRAQISSMVVVPAAPTSRVVSCSGSDFVIASIYASLSRSASRRKFGSRASAGRDASSASSKFDLRNERIAESVPVRIASRNAA